MTQLASFLRRAAFLAERNERRHVARVGGRLQLNVVVGEQHRIERETFQAPPVLRRRLESIKRIHLASDELEDRIAELEQAREALESQIGALEVELRAIDEVVEAADPLPLAANG